MVMIMVGIVLVIMIQAVLVIGQRMWLVSRHCYDATA
jgi:hypothetical protein